MKRTCRLPLLVLLVTLPPAVQAADQPPAKPPAPTQVFLLDNYRILEAPGERVGDVYRLRVGNEVRDVPAKQVLFVGESRDAVQKFLLAQAAKPRPDVATPLGLSRDATALFAAKVQPILMNACARCHCEPSTAGRFSLERVRLGYADSEPTLRNARATEGMGGSLLAKAVSPHGGDRSPPPPSRDHPAYRNLDLFVQAVGPVSASPVPATNPSRETLGGSGPAMGSPPPAKDDPFDPDVFNSRFRAAR
jgi:hypothetical protein